MGINKADRGWELRESGPAKADHTVLLLPGGLCTAAFCNDVMTAPGLAGAPIRLVAATLPGFGSTRPPSDLSMESYARLAGKLARDLGCDVVVGHSLGANVAIEMAAAGEFSGPVVLLSPTFSRGDVVKVLGLLDRIGRVPVIGSLAWIGALKLIPSVSKSSFPVASRGMLIAEMKKNDPRFCRRETGAYFEYLDRHGSLVSRLCELGVEAWVVRGDRDEIGLTDDERRGLGACPRVRLVTVADATHMVLTDQPARVAEVILDAVSAAVPR